MRPWTMAASPSCLSLFGIRSGWRLSCRCSAVTWCSPSCDRRPADRGRWRGAAQCGRPRRERMGGRRMNDEAAAPAQPAFSALSAIPVMRSHSRRDCHVCQYSSLVLPSASFAPHALPPRLRLFARNFSCLLQVSFILLSLTFPSPDHGYPACLPPQLRPSRPLCRIPVSWMSLFYFSCYLNHTRTSGNWQWT